MLSCHPTGCERRWIAPVWGVAALQRRTWAREADSVEPRRPDTERTLPDGESTDPAAQPAHASLRDRKSVFASAFIVIALFGLGVVLAHPFSSSPARSGAAVPTSTALPPAPPFGLAQTPQPSPATIGTPDAGDGSDGSDGSDGTPTADATPT